jgi:putative transposase
MRAPVVMVGDGALGRWRALGEVFPETREQRCWVHKVANVLNALPKSVQAGARRALNEIAQAEDRAHAEQAIQALVSDYGAKWPKAVAKITDDQEALLAFYDYPAEHWLHLRTTNPIESTFSPVRARTRVTKGPGNKDAGLAMVFKLLEAAEGRWRAVNGRIWSRWCVPAPGSRKASWSSDPRRRQRRTSTRSPRDHAGRRSTGFDDSSSTASGFP